MRKGSPAEPWGALPAAGGRRAPPGRGRHSSHPGVAEALPGTGRGTGGSSYHQRVWAMLQPLGKGLLQALGTGKSMWIAQSSSTHTYPYQANSVGSPAAAGYCPKSFTHGPWSMGRRIKVWLSSLLGWSGSCREPAPRESTLQEGSGSPLRVGQQPGCRGNCAPEGFMQLTRPDLSLCLSLSRLCHCSFSSLAACPTPEERNKKDEVPALPCRVNRCLSPWELLPPQTSPG